MNNPIYDDIDTLFNLYLVYEGARPAFLLEMQNSVRNMYSPQEYINYIKDIKEFSKLYIQEESLNRYLITKNKVPLPKTDKELAKLLDFDCKGISKKDIYYILHYVAMDNYTGNSETFYTAICPEKNLFKGKNKRLKKYSRVGEKYNFTVSMNIQTFTELTLKSFKNNTDFWINNQDLFFGFLEGSGIEFLSGYDLDFLYKNHKDILLFTLLRLENDPLQDYYPLTVKQDRQLIETEKKIYKNLNINPITAFDKLEKDFIKPELGLTKKYKIKKCILYQKFKNLK